MKHYFEISTAVTYGVNAAILLENIAYWTAVNEANGVNFYDGLYWTYNSRKAMQQLFPYMSRRQIETAIDKLVEAGLVVVGNYNKSTYDRTLWYALTQKGKCISHFEQMDMPNLCNGSVRFCEMDFTPVLNGSAQNVKPIPDINTDINTDIESKGRAKRFTPPTLEEVAAYCRERGNSVSPERFIDYYTSNGWKVGRNPMKDWKAAVRNWEKGEKPKAQGKDTGFETNNPFLEMLEERRNGHDL